MPLPGRQMTVTRLCGRLSAGVKNEAVSLRIAPLLTKIRLLIFESTWAADFFKVESRKICRKWQ